jgi:NADH-ubiquinone oxidoreductase chain 2
MIIVSILATLLSNALTIRRDIAILYNRIAILILIYCILLDISSLNLILDINSGASSSNFAGSGARIGLHGGLLLVTNITQIFHIFLYGVSIVILALTSFYPRKV